MSQHCAASSPIPKRKQVVEALIRKGATLNDKNKEFVTPLHIAADKAHYDVMDVLLKHGAKVMVVNDQWILLNLVDYEIQMVGVYLCVYFVIYMYVVYLHTTKSFYMAWDEKDGNQDLTMKHFNPDSSGVEKIFSVYRSRWQDDKWSIM